MEEEDETMVRVQSNPYGGIPPVEIPKNTIDERRPSTLSVMPTELLSTFRREEIMDLLAYLESLRDRGDS